MGLLDRYRKAGGFLQLLQVLETTGDAKRDQFLEMIRKEDSRWFEAIQKKMLTIDRIFSWDDNTIAEITIRMNELTLAVALHGLTKYEDKIFKTFTSMQKRRVTDLSQTKKPALNEISAAYIKIIEEVRSMTRQGFLRFEKFDPDLMIEENFEDKLSAAPRAEVQAPSPFEVEQLVVEAKNTVLNHEDNHAQVEVIEKLSNQISMLSGENKKLKNELRHLKDKLEQIRKIA